MPKQSEWVQVNSSVRSQSVPVKLNGETVATFDKFSYTPKAEPKTLADAAKALGFKKESNAIKALLAGRNKMNATRARAQAKLNDLE